MLQAAVRVGLVEELRVVDECPRRANVDADGHAEEVVNGRHPARVAASQVVVDGDQVDALAGEGVQVQGKARHQRFALACLHLGDLALVQDDAPDELDVEVPHADRSLRRLTAQGESLDQELVGILALDGALPQLVRPRPKAGVVKSLQLGFDLIDGRRHREVTLHLPLVRVQQLGQVQH